MQQVNIFTTSIFTGYVSIVNKSKLIEYVLQEESHASGEQLSNHGGWQSSSMSQQNCPVIFNDLISEVYKNVEEYYQTIGVNRSPELGNFWINVNRKHNYNSEHLHPHSLASVCVYLKVPKGNAGSLKFIRDDVFHSIWDMHHTPSNTETYSTYAVAPEEQQIVIFPAYVRHMVMPNLTNDQDDARISLAFNFI